MVGFFWLLSALVFLTLILHLAARFWFTPRATWMFDRLPWLPVSWYGPFGKGEDVEFFARDGVRLCGTYLATLQEYRRGILLYCHELNADRWNVRPIAELLRGRGFDVFTFDFRNHGTSDRIPGCEPSPWVTPQDVADVQGALDYLATRPNCDSPVVGMIGVGKGAAVAICSAAGDPRVRGVVAEGLYPTRPIGARLVGRFSRASWLAALLDRLVRCLDRWALFVLGCRRGNRFLDVERFLGLCCQPILLVHGELDGHVPIAWLRLMHRRMARGSNLWIVRGAKHGAAAQTAAEQYASRVGRFLDRPLASSLPGHGGRPISPPAQRMESPVAPITTRAMPSA